LSSQNVNILCYIKLAEFIENSRSLAYTSRVAAVMRNLPKIMANSRPLAYASEVGESVRPITSRKFVRFMYGLSWGYVILDTAIKTHAMKKHGREAMAYCCLDTSIFHTFASMALPAFTIHSIVKYSGKFFKKILGTESKVGKWLPVICGLGSIPFIIHPLDHFTELVMDKSIRKIYGHKIPGLYEREGHN
jgi:fission process protein 1